jgi:hypothetical protein
MLLPDFGNREPLDLLNLGASDYGPNRTGRIDVGHRPDTNGFGKSSPKLDGLLASKNLVHVLWTDADQKILPWFARRHCASYARIIVRIESAPPR